MSFKKLMLTAGGGGAGGWILNYSPSSFNGNPEFITVRAYDEDDTNNIYAIFANGNDTDVVQLTSDGSVTQTKRYDTNSGANYFYTDGLVVDSSDNLYITGGEYDYGTSAVVGAAILKVNSSFTEQWESFFYTTYGAANVVPAFYGSDLYILTHANDFNSSGRQLGFEINGSSRSISNAYGFNGVDGNYNRGIHIDGSGNIFSSKGGRYGSSVRPMIRKFGTSFSSLAWQIAYQSNSSGQGNDITTDSSGNVYSCGQFLEGNRRRGWVAKFNSSGSNQWMKGIQSEGTPTSYGGFNSGYSDYTAVSCKVTSHGLVVVYYDYGNVSSYYNDINIMVFNLSTGSLEESYGISCTSSSWQNIQQNGNTHVMTTDDHVYVPIRDNNNNAFILKLPVVDGSGIYGNYSLGSHSFTINSTNFSYHNPDYSWGSYTSGSGGSRTISRRDNNNRTAASTTPTTSKLDI